MIGRSLLTGGSSAVSATSYATASVTPGSNRLELLWVLSKITAGAPAAPTVTSPGLTWVQVATVPFNANTMRLTVFRALAAAPTTGAATISFGAVAQTACEWSWLEFTVVPTSGTNGSGAVAASATATGSATKSLGVTAGTPSDLYQAVVSGFAHSTAEVSYAGDDLHVELDDRNVSAMALETQFGTELDADSAGKAWALWATASEAAGIAVLVNTSALFGAGPTDYPTKRVEVCTSQPGFPPAAKTWVDQTDKLFRISGGYGRDTELDKFPAGGRSYFGDNTGGDFLPDNTGGSMSPNFKVGREIRESWFWKGERRRRFRGKITDIRPTREADYSEVELVCTDMLEPILTVPLAPVAGLATLQTALIGTNNDLVYTDKSGRGQAISISYIVPQNGSAFTYVLISGGVDIQVYLRTDPNNPLTITATANEVASAVQSGAGQLVSVANAPGNTGVGVVTALAKTQLGGGIPSELSGARVGRCLDDAGYPASWRDLDVGVALVQSTSVSATGATPSSGLLTSGGQAVIPSDPDKAGQLNGGTSAYGHAQDVAVNTELGQLFCDGRGWIVFQDRNARSAPPFSTVFAVFSDAPGVGEYPYDDPHMVPVYSLKRVLNKWYVTRAGSDVVAVASDATSIAEHGPRTTGSPWSTLLALDSDLAGVGAVLLARYKDPKTRFDSLALTPAGPADPLWDVLFDLMISHRVTIERTPPGSSAITVDCFVEGLNDEIDFRSADPLTWTMTCPLSGV